jgi:hypothetical protein
MNLIKLNNKIKDYSFHFTYSCDFRLRIYNNSNCGHTFNKFSRLIVEQKNNIKEMNDVKMYRLIIKMINHKNIRNIYIKLYYTLFQIGKIYYKKYMEKNNKFKISVKNLLEIGLKNINNIEINDFYDKFQIIYYSKIYHKLISNKTVNSIIIEIDANASGIQNMGLFYGYKNYDIVNLNNDNYIYDFYMFMINELKKVSIINNLDKNITDIMLTRKNYKMILMTKEYNAGINNTYKYLKDLPINEEIKRKYHKILYNSINNILYKEVYIKKYNYIYEIFDTINSIKKINLKIINKLIETNYIGSVNFTYLNKLEKEKKRITYNKKTIKYT